MDPRAAIAAILVICLALVVVTYVLGVEAGQASKLQLHPGYEGYAPPARPA